MGSVDAVRENDMRGYTCRRALGLGIVGAVVALCVIAWPPLATQANTSCSGFVANFDGTNPINNNMAGAGANISTHVPWLCTTNDTSSDVSVWAMIAGGGNSEYAQAGYGRHYGQSTVYYFTEYDQNSSTAPVHKEYGSPGGGTTHNYYAAYGQQNGYAIMMIDNSVGDITNFNPSLYWSEPWSPEWEGETHDAGDDMPGTSGNPTVFSNMDWLQGNNWLSTSGLSVSSTSSRYGVSQASGTQFNIWT